MSNFTKLKLCHNIGISQSTHLWMTGIFTLLLLFLTGSKAKAQSDLTFNEGIRYSQWVIDSRMNNFYANTTECGFAVYDQTGKQTAGRKDGKTSLDYVVGLVAKSIIEASQYYSQFQWAQSFAKPWFLSIQNYGDNFYSKFRTVGGSLDDLNAVKLFVPLREMTSTNGVYPNTATYNNTKTALDKAIVGLKTHNTKYSIKSGTLAETGGEYNVLGGWWHKEDYQNQMWLDGAYMGPALFAQLVNYSEKMTNIDPSNDWDLIVKQFEILRSLCWNSTDELPYHAFAADGGTNKTSHSDTWAGLSSKEPYCFHSASYWGRAAGWYFLALVDILDEMDKAKISASDPKYTKLKGYLTEIAQGLAKRQDQATGGWYQILDKDKTYSASEYNNGQSHTKTYNYIESSATALFTAAYLKAIRLGYIAETGKVTVNNSTEKTYKDIAINGYKCLVNNFFSLDSDGKVNIFGSCRSAGLGGNTDKNAEGKERFRDGSNAYYLLGYDVAKVEKSENKTEGKVLGAFILAATEYERLYQNKTLLAKDLNPSYTIKSGKAISVEVLGDVTPTYQWYNASTDQAVSGAKDASFKPATSGKYYCKITVKPATSAKTRVASTGTYEITTRATEVTVAAASTPYTVTFNAGSNGTCSTTSLTQESAGASITLPDATPKSGYTFDGWYTAAEGGSKVGSPYTPKDNITLYAHYKSTGSTTVLFSLTNVTSETVNLAASSTLTLTASHATIKGGSAEVYNNKGSEVKIITGSQIKLGGSGDSYLHIKLSGDETLQVGDVITFGPSDATSFYISNTNDKNSKITTTSNSYTITKGDILVGKSEIYIFKNKSNSISSVTITRFKGIIINNQPTNAAFDINAATGSISITASASDNSDCTYQWYKCDDSSGTNPQIISGETSATYSPDKSTVGTYYYYCVVSAGSWTPVTSNIVKVTINKIKLILEYSVNGKTEWTWNSTTTPEKPAFTSPTVKAYKTDAKGNKTDLLEDQTLSYKYDSDVTDVATVNNDGEITIIATGNGGAKVYASLKENAKYYADPAAFDILIEQGYSFSVGVSETAPAINTSRYIEKTTAEGTEKLVKMTFGGWKWKGLAREDAPEETLGSYKVVRKNGTTYYTDLWNNSGTKASDIASIDGHYYWWNGENDAVDESKAASKDEYGNEATIYGSVRYGWFKSPEHDDYGKTTTSYPFSLPVRGSYMTFEPYMNGTLTIYILQNGAWNTNDNGGTYNQGTDGSIEYAKGDIIPGVFRPHAFQVVNQRGLTVQEFSPNYSVSTKQKVDSRYYCMFPNDEDYNEAKYNNPYNVAKWTEFADYMSEDEKQRAHAKWNSGPLGAQEIIELDNGSFLAVQKGIVKYTFHVTGNETYYFFSNFSKMGFSGANFVPDKAQPVETADDGGKIHSLELSDVTKYESITATPNGIIDGSNLINYTYKIGNTDIAPVGNVFIPQFYSIKLNRTFTPDQWTTLCLPFNLTQEEVQKIFGAGTQIIMLNNATLINKGARLEFIYHEIQNVLPGYPYLIKPTLVPVDATNDAKVNVTKTGNTITSFTVYGKCINPSIIPFEVDTNPYTFKGTPGYCTADKKNNKNVSGYSVNYKANDIFVSEGDGKLYVSGGTSYGKGYRAWLENKTGITTPVKSISVVMSSFSDDDDTTTSIDVAEMAPDLIEALGIQTGVYNLSGQRVANDTRNLKAGIYIVNGKKTVVR